MKNPGWLHRDPYRSYSAVVRIPVHYNRNHYFIYNSYFKGILINLLVG